jgi:hypothetical protein
MFFLLLYIEKLNPPIFYFFLRIYFLLCVRGKNIPQHPDIPGRRADWWQFRAQDDLIRGGNPSGGAGAGNL